MFLPLQGGGKNVRRKSLLVDLGECKMDTDKDYQGRSRAPNVAGGLEWGDVGRIAAHFFVFILGLSSVVSPCSSTV